MASRALAAIALAIGVQGAPRSSVFKVVEVDGRVTAFRASELAPIAVDGGASLRRASAEFCASNGLDVAACAEPLFDATASQLRAPEAAEPFGLGDCAADAESAELQRSALADGSAASCDDVGACTCPAASDVFNGRRCIAAADAPSWSTNRGYWSTVPGTRELYVPGGGAWTGGNGETVNASLLLELESDDDLAAFHDSVRADDTFTQFLGSTLKGQRVLDVGSGLGRQSVAFALLGAHVTFLDVVPANQAILRRVLRAKGLLEAETGAAGAEAGDAEPLVQLALFDSLATLDAALARATAPLRPGGPRRLFDAIFACGSLHHLPRELIVAEMAVLLPYLRGGGRWIQLAYPLARWRQWPAAVGGATPHFGLGGFGQIDGPRTPWAEWYSPGKLRATLARAAAAVQCADDADAAACAEPGVARTAGDLARACPSGARGGGQGPVRRARQLHLSWCGTIGFPAAVAARGPDYNWVSLTVG